VTCPACRPSVVPIVFGSSHYEAHLRRGIVRTRCPGCDEYRWPWEYPEPEWPASGLRWVWSDGSWELFRCGEYQGVVKFGSHSRRHYAVRNVRYVHTGTLHDCALALVAEVRR
jgi:hypothetical protein